jgi:hypothetical protein
MSAGVDRIMYLAGEMADAKVAHAKAVAAFANDDRDVTWEQITALAKTYTDAANALRAEVTALAGAR